MEGRVQLEGIEYPEIYQSKYILSYLGLNSQLEEMIDRSGFKKVFSRQYRKCLIFLEKLKKQCTYQASFERLVNDEEIYSMRLKGEKNIRILFTFIVIGDKEHAVLLHAFQEKDGTKKGKDGYTINIAIALKKKHQLLI